MLTAHTVIVGARVMVYCAKQCRPRTEEPSGQLVALPLPPQSRRRHLGAKSFLLVLVIALLAMQKNEVPRSPLVAADFTRSIASARASLEVAASEADLETARLQALREKAEREERAWREQLSTDRWVHPLPGPKRRMPVRVSRVFGAQRPGHRPSECQAGHCGVDIGGEVWGEPILASHDGVAVRVNRDPSRSGGKYVRIGHRDDTVFTQYFHLAAIPKQLRDGSKIRAGQVIGLLGETGIDHSGAHLHFTVSVRQAKNQPEQFIDPEPLIALWPVAVPVFGDVGSISHTYLVPGRPRGPFRKQRKRAPKAPTIEALPGAPESAPVEEPTAAAQPLSPIVPTPDTVIP